MGTQHHKIRQDDIRTSNEGAGGWNSFKIWEDQMGKIKTLVDSMNPTAVKTASDKYEAMSTRMNTTAQLLFDQAYKVVDSWGGEAAKKCMDEMNKAYRQAQEIYSKSTTTKGALASHATTQNGWQQAYGSGSTLDTVVNDWGKYMRWNPNFNFASNWGAGDVMDTINNGTTTSNSQFPEDIRADMPTTNVRDPDLPGPGPGGPGADTPKMPGGPGGGAPGDMPGGPGGPGMPEGPGGPGDPGGPGMPPGPGGPGGPDFPGPGGPGGPDGPGSGGPGGGIPGGGGIGSDLASMPPGGGGPGGGMPGGGPGLGGGAPGGGMPGGVGSGAGAGGGIPGAGAMGRGAPGMGGMGMPMGGAGGRGGGDGEEHERSTWLTEDEDVWGGNDDTAPPVIG